MKVIGFLSFFIVNCFSIYGQSPDIDWQKTFGGSLDDIAYSICKTSDGGFIIVGETSSNNGDVSINKGAKDVWLIKIDSLGNLEWEKTLGGSGYDTPNSIFQKLDNGYTVFGSTDSKNGDVIGLHQDTVTHQYDYDGWLINTDSLGDIQWQKCLGGIDRDIGKNLFITQDNYYLITMEVFSNDGDVTNLHGQSDYWLSKIDTFGNIIWGKTYGGLDYESPSKSIELSDGTYILAGGSTYDFGGYHGTPGLGGDIGILHLDSSGSVIWSKSIGGTGLEYPWSLISGNNGDFYIAVDNTSSNGDVATPFYGGSDFWIIKVDNSGSIIWQNSIGGSSYDTPSQILSTTDGGLIVTGTTSSSDFWVTGFKGYFDWWVVKYDSIGNLEWEKCLGGNNWEESYSIVETSDHGYIICGFTKSADGDVTFNHGGKDIWIVKLSPQDVLVPELHNTIKDLIIYQTEDKLLLSFISEKNEKGQLLLYDITGKNIYKKNVFIRQGANHEVISSNDFTRGLYFLSLNGYMNRKVFLK